MIRTVAKHCYLVKLELRLPAPQLDTPTSLKTSRTVGFMNTSMAVCGGLADEDGFSETTFPQCPEGKEITAARTEHEHGTASNPLCLAHCFR